MSAPSEIFDLVERFERQLDAYKSGQYNETQLRREFLDPLFKALGWDLDNTAGYAEACKDVIHEDQIRVEYSLPMCHLNVESSTTHVDCPAFSGRLFPGLLQRRQ